MIVILFVREKKKIFNQLFVLQFVTTNTTLKKQTTSEVIRKDASTILEDKKAKVRFILSFFVAPKIFLQDMDLISFFVNCLEKECLLVLLIFTSFISK